MSDLLSHLEGTMTATPPDTETNNDSDHNAKVQISLIAGYKPDGEAIIESVTVERLQSPNDSATIQNQGELYRLSGSPAFVRGLAAGDRIRFPSESPSGYELIKRSGNLSIRVLRKQGIEEVLQSLTPEIELLDGVLDLETPRLLVYSIHVSIGFQAIEILLDRICGQFPGTLWYYGNVYDPEDGVTPLDWWQEFLAPV